MVQPNIIPNKRDACSVKAQGVGVVSGTPTEGNGEERSCSLEMLLNFLEPKGNLYGIEKAALMEILGVFFPNGIRPKSTIDINRLKNCYKEIVGEPFPSFERDIPSLLNAIGVRHGEKIFAVSSKAKQELAGLVEELCLNGNRIYYYTELYDKHFDFLQSKTIFSPELLKTVLSITLPDHLYYKNYFLVGEKITIESEVTRCFKSAVSLSYDQIKSQLPYVPIEKIKQVLAQNSDFIWVNNGTYTYKTCILIDEKDRIALKIKVEDDLSNYGYCSLAAINCEKTLELNPNLSETAVRNGLFQNILGNRYEKRGNIITKKGKILNTVAVLKDYCLSQRNISLNELLEFHKETSGNIQSQALEVAYGTMIRADKDQFVCDSEIHFDVEATDKSLASFVHGDVIPLQAVSSFASFPYIVGYPWNRFLLESYCRRFSRNFSFQCLSVTSLNIGAITRKARNFTDYSDVLATAVAAASIRLNERDVGDFLVESGFIARRRDFIANVVVKARRLREGRA